MLLENIPNNDLGKCVLWMKGNEKEHFIPMNYHDYSNWAYAYNLQDILDLENSESLCFIAKNSVISSCLWFISIEAFVNTILKVLCIDNNVDFSDYKKRTLNSRITEINSIISFPHKEYCKSGLQAKLDEFETFRNEIFHDRTFENELKFSKTFLAKNPSFPNFISEIQALTISLEFFSFYRHIFKKLDLMPNIRIKSDKTFFFERLDRIYDFMLKPSIKEILKKHNLTTCFNFDYQIRDCISPYNGKNYFIQPIIKAIPKEELNSPLSFEKTDILKKKIDMFLKPKVIDDGKFGIPNYFDSKN